MAAPSAFASIILGTPVDVIGNLPAGVFTSQGYGTNSYKDWGNEPSVTVNPTNTNDIVVSSFSYGSSPTNGAQIFYSTNGGVSWTPENSIPQPGPSIGIPNDWNFRYNSSGTLYGAVLGGSCPPNCNIYAGSTTNPTSSAAWTWTGGGTQINSAASTNNADQPWLQVLGGNVFVAYDNFSSGTGELVTASTNGGTTFPTTNAINNGAQSNSVNPGTRIATDGAGNLYSIFGVGTSTGTNGVQNVTYYLNRSQNNGASWDFNGSSAIGGIVIGGGVSTQLDNAGTQASNNWFAGVNDLRGNVTAIAADSTGSHIYTLIGYQDGSGNNRIYLVTFQPSGSNLVASGPPLVISPAGEQAALPSVTVLANGAVVMMYDTYNSATNMVDVHVAVSLDFGASIYSDTVEYSFDPLSLPAATGSTTSNREFGDYQYITSLGDTFYGAFVGVGDVNSGGVNTTDLVDPFFFSGAVPEPGSLWLLLTGLAAAGWFYRRKSKPSRGATATA